MKYNIVLEGRRKIVTGRRVPDIRRNFRPDRFLNAICETRMVYKTKVMTREAIFGNLSGLFQNFGQTQPVTPFSCRYLLLCGATHRPTAAGVAGWK